MRFKVSLLGLLAAAACSGEVSVDDRVALSIAAPGDGAVVTRADDVDTSIAGIQLNVVVQVDGAIDGTVIVLDNAGGGYATAEAVDGQAVFPSFTLPRGISMLHASTQTCSAGGCTAEASLTVIDSDTQVAISVPQDGDVVGTGDVSVTIVRVSGTMPSSCSVDIDGQPIGNFIWENTAQPLVVASTLKAGTHVAQAFCRDWLDTVATQTVTFVVDGTPPVTAPVLVSEPPGPGSLDFDTPGAFVNLDTSDALADLGLQHAVTVLVDSDGESHRDWTVELTVTPPGGVATVYEQVVGDGTAPVQVTIDNVDFGDSDGDIDFEVLVLDSVGRASPTDSATLTIDRTPPSVVLTAPDPAQLVLSRPDDLEPASFDTVEVDFTVTTVDGVGSVALELDGAAPVAVPLGAPMVFPRSSLAAGHHEAVFATADVAGNIGTFIYAFDVVTFANSLEIVSPPDTVFNLASDDDTGTSGLQKTFSVDAAGLEDGATVVLCSTVPSPVVGAACRDGGTVVGTGVLSGDLAASTATFVVTLGEGTQTIHAEAFEVDDLPHVSSATRDVLVDTVPPQFVSIVFPTNNPANDLPGVVRIGLAESHGGRFVDIDVEVSEPGLTGWIVNGVIWGYYPQGTQHTFPLPGTAAHYTIAFYSIDLAGNRTQAPDIVVDVADSAGTVVVDPPTAALYTVSTTDIGVTISDTTGGGHILLERYAGTSGGPAFASIDSGTLAPSNPHIVFTAFPLAQGLNYLQASFTDAFGNTVVSDRVLYKVDAIGPTLTLGVRTAAGAVQACDTFSASCLADTLPFDAATSRIRLDRFAVNPTCGGFGPCSPDGTDLFFTLSQCVNSDPSLESCPVTVRLQSRLAGDPDWLDVVSGVFTSDDASNTSIASAPEFAPGVVRELRLVTEDTNHNSATSNSVFITLNFAGVVIEVERLDASFAAVGDTLANDRYFGIAENLLDSTTGNFAANFRAHLTPYGVSPTSARFIVDNGSGSTTYEVATIGGGTSADFAGVALLVAVDPASPSANAITLQPICGATICGERDYTGIVADITAPTYQFDRCSLCALQAPLVSTACPAACFAGDGDPGANIAGAGAAAIWNLALDADHDGSNGFNAPLNVKLAGLEDGRSVRLDTDLGSLASNVANATGCPAAATCVAAFPSLTASQLTGTLVRRISVSFTDRAGNAAVPDPVRIDAAHESIYARTDVIPPADVDASACIGESTQPASGFDAAMAEGPLCAAACSATGTCSRTAASAALTWSAPGDDGSTGGSPVVSYTIGIAALGIPYGGTTYTSCAELTTGGPFETTAVLPGAPQSAGAVEQVTVPGLYPHRDYCFLVVATDDVGNRSGGAASRRKIPLVTTPTIQSFDGVVRNDAQPAGAFHTEPAAPSTYGAFATTLPDLDADGRDDFAVTQLTSGSVQLYLSGTGSFAPAVTINAPAIAYSGTFGVSVAGGDLNEDNLNDLVICDSTLTTSAMPGGGAHGGAIFVYYGVAGSGIARNINTTTPQVPSLHPDLAMFGPAGAEICASMQFGDVTGEGIPDLAVITTNTSPAPSAYVLYGEAARFSTGLYPFNPSVNADVVVLSGFALDHLAVGDFDPDGSDEIAVSAADDVAIFYTSGATAAVFNLPGTTGFGNALLTVRAPATAPGDWLLVGTTDAKVAVYGTGFVHRPGNPPDGMLDNTEWDGTAAPLFGGTLASLGDFDGNGGVDIAVGSGNGPAGNTFVYSFDTTADTFVKRAILQGGAGFASTVTGVRAYSPGSPLGRSQIMVVQRGAARLFMFR